MRPGGLIVDFEWRSSREVVTGIEIGLELGFDHGRTSALLEAEDVSGNAATVLVARLADLLGDTEAGHFEVQTTRMRWLMDTLGVPMSDELLPWGQLYDSRAGPAKES